MALNQIDAISLSLLALGFSAAAMAQGPVENPLALSAYNVTFGVADLAKQAAWYEDVLGFRELLHVHPPNEEVEALQTPRFRIDLVWQKGSSRPPPVPYQQGYLHFTFKSDALDEDYKWLTTHGIKVDSVRDPKSHSLRRMTIHDPEDNVIEIKLAEPGIDGASDKVASGPAAAEEAGDNPLRRLRPADVTFMVSDLATEAAWYEKALGFRQTMHAKHSPTDEVTAVDIPDYQVFLLWHKGSVPASRLPNQQGCIHIAFRTTTYDEDYEWLTAHGIKVDVVGDPKSRVNRRMRVHDPDGNEIEIAAAQSTEGQGR